MTGFTRDTVLIPSAESGVSLDVWLYKPETGQAPFPLVVAGHGLTVVKAAGLAPFGERWATDAGYASLIFDYRGFGDSGGEPRNLVSLEKQYEDYLAVINWARTKSEMFHSDKIVVMGSATSGLSVARLVVEESGLAGGMGHSPLLDAYATLTAGPVNFRLLFWASIDCLREKLGIPPIYVKCIGRPDEFAMLNSPDCYPGFEFIFAQSDVPFSQRPNLVAPRLAFELLGARPGRKLKDAKCQMLVVYTKEDDIIPAAVTQSVAEVAAEKVILVEAPGGHFEIMKGGKSFDININAQLAFLRSLP